MQYWKKFVANDEINLAEYDVHDVCGCLKQLLRNLHGKQIIWSIFLKKHVIIDICIHMYRAFNPVQSVWIFDPDRARNEWRHKEETNDH